MNNCILFLVLAVGINCLGNFDGATTGACYYEGGKVTANGVTTPVTEEQKKRIDDYLKKREQWNDDYVNFMNKQAPNGDWLTYYGQISTDGAPKSPEQPCVCTKEVCEMSLVLITHKPEDD